MGVNKVILLGNVGRDVEFRSLPTGTNMAKFSLATTDRRFKDDDGKPRTEWHNVVAWGKLAEICNNYLKKGSQLYIEGQIRTRTYEQDGQKRWFTEVHIEEMEMMGAKGEGQRSEPRASGGETRGFGDLDDVPF